ncbi:hypothetical protein LINGRAHAP2_LOCUS11614, partial [Linum grandiflorum]
YYSRAFLVKAALLNCGRTKILHLEGLNLSEFPGHTTCWYNLQELTLRSVQVIKGCFTSYLANAPLLEKLSLTNISGLDSLDVSASNFPSLEFLSYDQSAYDLNQLHLSSAPFLQTLNFWGNGNVPNVVSAPNLKFVRLEFGGELWRAQYKDMISKLPSLETLHLNVTPDARFRISSHMLRKLTLGCFKRETELLIDAPNLITLSITAFVLPININIVNVASSCQSQCVVECYLLYDEEITKSWFTDLRKCLATLTARFHHLVFTLVFIEKFCLKLTEMELSEIGCGSSPIVVQHLQLGTDLPLGSGVNRLLDGILCTFDPKTVSLARLSSSCHNESLFSYITSEVKMKSLENCCTSGKCWRHRLKDAKVTSFTVDHLETMKKSMISEKSINMIISLVDCQALVE